MRTTLLVALMALASITMPGCGSDEAAPEAGAEASKISAPTNDRERAVQGLKAREAGLGTDGSAAALEHALELRDAQDAQRNEALKAANGE